MPEALSAAELLRYSRHLLIPMVGESGHLRLKHAAVLLIGAGALGSPAALYLAAAGVGRLGLVDDDVVEVSNLQRQLLHSDAWVGQPKLASAAARLREVNPHVELELHAQRLTPANALEIARRYDMVLSLGDGLRPGAIADATDQGQLQELIILGELAGRARAADVQVMIEGPGHVPIRDIEANIKLQKKICQGAPFYVLGPLPTDIAPGYDHITSAIGGAIAGAAGADFLCYVTPAEHLRLPTLEDVREGVIAARIAAHIADIAKGVNGAQERDYKMSQCRKNFDWQGQVDLSIDPVKAKALLEKSKSADEEGCTMCGEFCAIRLGKK